eukprot:2597745-Amphidinium_carterae.2
MSRVVSEVVNLRSVDVAAEQAFICCRQASTCEVGPIVHPTVGAMVARKRIATPSLLLQVVQSAATFLAAES